MRHIDWERYRQLAGKKKEEMTEEEWDFFSYMYFVEEFKGGLEGDLPNDDE